METPPVDIETIIDFIARYRYLENSILEEGYRMCRKMVVTGNDAEGLYDHLCSQWRGKKRNFGDFFLNLSTSKQILVLQNWGIGDSADAKYLDIEKDDPVKYLFAEPPATVAFFNSLVKFFYNNGISSIEPYQDHPGIKLASVPADMKRRFGNSANWGDYILSLDSPIDVIEQIYTYTRMSRVKSQ